MKRRTFLQVPAVLGIAAFGGPRLSAGVVPHVAPFYIAGVRYQTPPIRKPLKGERLLLLREAYDADYCFAVYTADWDRLGYVPDALVPHLPALPRCEATLSDVNPHALPWKRYLVHVSSSISSSKKY